MPPPPPAAIATPSGLFNATTAGQPLALLVAPSSCNALPCTAEFTVQCQGQAASVTKAGDNPVFTTGAGADISMGLASALECNVTLALTNAYNMTGNTVQTILVSGGPWEGGCQQLVPCAACMPSSCDLCSRAKLTAAPPPHACAQTVAQINPVPAPAAAIAGGPSLTVAAGAPVALSSNGTECGIPPCTYAWALYCSTSQLAELPALNGAGATYSVSTGSNSSAALNLFNTTGANCTAVLTATDAANQTGTANASVQVRLSTWPCVGTIWGGSDWPELLPCIDLCLHSATRELRLPPHLNGKFAPPCTRSSCRRRRRWR